MLDKPVVFSDFHQSSLYESLMILFENRLGGTLYRPIGEDWYYQGFWKIYDHPDTIKQFLGLDQRFKPVDGTPALNQIDKIDQGVYWCQDIPSGKQNKAITLDAFWKIPIDIVIASIPEHIEPFKRLTELHSRHPKLIFQVGNAFSVESPTIKNVLASAVVDKVPPGINLISYHQEFPLDVFHFGEPEANKNIYSFVNCFNTADIFHEDWKLFEEVEQIMPDYHFKSFGGQCRDGSVGGDKAVSDKERESMFIWHTKAGGDGYGHIIFNSAFVGRPLIVKKEYYKGKLGEKLMIDEKTCITIDGLRSDEIANKIIYWSDPTRYKRLCFGTYDNAKEKVNFNEEETKIKDFLEHLL